jgi:hypothetical protein
MLRTHAASSGTFVSPRLGFISNSQLPCELTICIQEL